MQTKFRVLRIVALIWKILAWIVLVSSILGGCGMVAIGFLSGANARSLNQAFGGAAMGGLGGIIVALGAIFVGIFYFVSLYAVAELVDVMLALEENTRATAEQLKNIAKT